MRGPIQRGDSVVVSTVAGASHKAYPLARIPNNTSYKTVSDQPEATLNQPVTASISFHGGLAYDHYDERTGGCLVNTGILTNEPNVLRAPVKVNTVTLTDAAAPPMYFFEAKAPNATVTYDAKATGKADGTNVITWSHTVGSDADRYLLVGLARSGTGNALTVTLGSQSLTSLGVRVTGNDYAVELWGLVNPTSGAGTITATYTSGVNRDRVGHSTSWENVDQANPVGSFVSGAGTTGGPLTVNAATATGDEAVDICVANNQALTVDGSQDEHENDSQDTCYAGMSSETATGASTTMSWTIGSSTNWAVGTISLKQAATPVLYMNSVEPGETNAYKVSMNNTNFGTLLNTKTWAGVMTQPMGRPAEWTSGGSTVWLMPLGDNVLLDSLTTIASSTSNDTWSGGTDAYARHLLVVKNQLYRTAGDNNINVLPRNTDPETDSGWTGNYYVGDAGFKITDIAQVAGICSIPKEDGLWEFDGVAEASNVLPELGIAERNGQGLSFGRGGFFVPGVAGLYWTRTGEPIGPEGHDDYHIANDPSIGAGEYFKHGRWMGTANYNGHFYGLYVNSLGTSALVVWGYPVGNEWRFYAIASVTADLDDFHGIYVSETSKFSASEVRPCLWFANGNNLSYIWLDKNGAPMLRRGDIDVAPAATVTSGRIDFGYPRVLKQLRFISGWAEDMEAGATDHSFTLKVYRDGGTVESVPPTSSTITTDGYFGQYWTQDTNDTCRSLLFSAVFAGGTDTTDINGPLIRDVQVHAVLQPTVTRVWEFLLMAEDKPARTAKAIRTEWEAYIGDLLKFELPDGDSFNGVASPLEMLRADEIDKLTPRNQEPPNYIFRATVREMPSS